MSLLDNPLILKYFGYPEGSVVEVCEHEINLINQKVKEKTALHILEAMQEPIRKGERYLYVEREDHCYMTNTTEDAEAITGFHPNMLRLLDRFQPSQTKECDHRETKCMTCGVEFPVPTPTSPPEKGWTAGMPNLPKPPIGEYNPLPAKDEAAYEGFDCGGCPSCDRKRLARWQEQ